MRATAKQVEILNHALNGFRFLKENHEAVVDSAVVSIDGADFKVERDYNMMEFDADDASDNGEFGVLVVDFE